MSHTKPYIHRLYTIYIHKYIYIHIHVHICTYCIYIYIHTYVCTILKPFTGYIHPDPPSQPPKLPTSGAPRRALLGTWALGSSHRLTWPGWRSAWRTPRAGRQNHRGSPTVSASKSRIRRSKNSWFNCFNWCILMKNLGIRWNCGFIWWYL